MMKNMSRAIVVVNKSSFISMSIRSLKLKNGSRGTFMEEINEPPLLVPDMVELVASIEEAIISLHDLSGVSTP